MARTDWLVEKVNQMNVGQSLNVNQKNHESGLIELELDYWRFQDSLDDDTGLLDGIVKVYYGEMGMLRVTFAYNKDLIRRICEVHNWFGIKCPSMIQLGVKDEYIPCYLLSNSRTVIFYKTSPLESVVNFIDCNKNKFKFKFNTVQENEIVEGKMYTSNPSEVLLSTLDMMVKPELERPSCDYRLNIYTHFMVLTKSQVAFLIGHKGSRIEEIRESTQTTIKILPISKKLTKDEISHPSRVKQTISITGDQYSVELAIATIDSHLRLHLLSPNILL
ncbi:hypothetical protein Kpol_1014p36 [Vanderwaltozyma polyspora DSM 70294]|uniref:K Homology domain-containing protein n=1 Tax=Vanderwaltozyma polyspora (strain ATCC 22028 / DSM 70294 / BCRC 21397 / CBS 2163 / NBRC 10782 / NRRL Y-8283 / UCD 57-17) TaxID=436907 RepID=A7TNG3_VANPO|nr:uncharacterized protein Kpol_1014p36 [Vanderwaltozyma polyspora DSM 70294]EDO16216.1 hypothetical protein Kpol_1014p36 [Vanderwaltozyma polyspora DSM 70294]